MNKPPTVAKIKKWLKINYHCHNQTDTQVDTMEEKEVYLLQSMVFSAEGMNYPNRKPHDHILLMSKV